MLNFPILNWKTSITHKTSYIFTGQHRQTLSNIKVRPFNNIEFQFFRIILLQLYLCIIIQILFLGYKVSQLSSDVSCHCQCRVLTAWQLVPDLISHNIITCSIRNSGSVQIKVQLDIELFSYVQPTIWCNVLSCTPTTIHVYNQLYLLTHIQSYDMKKYFWIFTISLQLWFTCSLESLSHMSIFRLFPEYLLNY